MNLCGAYATQSTETSIFLAPLAFASARRAAMTSLTGTIDPRILEHAEKATIRVFDEMRGRRSSILWLTEYGLSGDFGVGFQCLTTAPRRAASFFQGPTLAC